jgi:hypothetical protein
MQGFMGRLYTYVKPALQERDLTFKALALGYKEISFNKS